MQWFYHPGDQVCVCVFERLMILWFYLRQQVGSCLNPSPQEIPRFSVNTLECEFVFISSMIKRWHLPTFAEFLLVSNQFSLSLIPKYNTSSTNSRFPSSRGALWLWRKAMTWLLTTWSRFFGLFFQWMLLSEDSARSKHVFATGGLFHGSLKGHALGTDRRAVCQFIRATGDCETADDDLWQEANPV